MTVYQKVKYRTESYEYDAMGNRTVERHLLRKEYAYYYEYYDKSNRLKTNGRFAYEYDANGNLIRKGNRYEIDGETVTFVTSGEGVEYWEYYYDLFNRLEEVKKNGETVARYLYDPNGFRVEKVSSKGKVHYVQLLNGEVGYRKEITVNKEYSFIYFAGFHLARVDGVIGGTGKKYFYHNDHLGSALAVTDEEGNKVIERDFLPFGEIINLQEGSNPYADGSGFTGKDWDEEIGLYYFNARWYDPEIGRFISQDPAADDPNLYSYCFNNPLILIDPTGTTAKGVFSIGNAKINLGQGILNYLIGKAGLSEIAQAYSAFSLFINVKTNLSNYIIGFEGSCETGIAGVRYKHFSRGVYEGLRLVKTTTMQFFESDQGTIAVTTINSGAGTIQTYTIWKADGTYLARCEIMPYNPGMNNQRNTLVVEGMIEDGTPFKALKLVLTKDGVIAAFQGSTLSSNSYKDADGSYKINEDFEEKIIAEGRYELYNHLHGGSSWKYDALRLGKGGYGTPLPVAVSTVPIKGEDGTIIGYEMLAWCVNDHSASAAGVNSKACQNTAPKAPWFSIMNGVPKINRPSSLPGNPSKGFVSEEVLEQYYPTYKAYYDIMYGQYSPSEEKTIRQGNFIGYQDIYRF